MYDVACKQAPGESLVQYGKVLSKYGQQLLVMVNKTFKKNVKTALF